MIFDEISRCRPDIQNKLFPIIHERRVQGIALDDLRFRWAAMNPPSTDDDDIYTQVIDANKLAAQGLMYDAVWKTAPEIVQYPNHGGSS